MDLNLGGIFLSEMLGTFFLILIGCGVNASVNLKKTYSNNSGWIVISFGWGMGVMIGASIAFYSGGHLNPAVTLAMWAESVIDTGQAFVYFAGELVGAFLGALLVAFLFWDHFKETNDQKAVAGTFHTTPAIPRWYRNLATEMFATSALVLPLLALTEAGWDTLILGPLFAGLLVLGIGLTLGGLTGYAINPARDLMPRLVHQIVKIPNKGTSNWQYSWVPIIGPLMGSMLAVAFYELIVVAI